MKQTYFIRLYWRDFEYSDRLHELILSKGCKIISREVVGIADCDIYEVDKLPDPLPEKWTVLPIDKFRNNVLSILDDLKRRNDLYDIAIEKCDEIDDYQGSWVYRGQRLESNYIIKRLQSLIDATSD